ncbi:hypothetical protein JCM11251_000616 [Rhodosporidiobolus azoricus]
MFKNRGDVDELAGALASTQIGAEYDPIARPDTGTAGRPFGVLTNAYEVKPPTIICHHYDVKIKPDKTPTPPRLNREIWAFLSNDLKVFGDVAVCYDGRGMAYSPVKLPHDEGTWNIVLPESDDNPKSTRDFTIKIKNTRPIDLNRLKVFVSGEALGTDQLPDPSEVQSAIQALNVLIQHGPSMIYPSRAASFFLPPGNPAAASISRGLTMWRGFYNSLRLGPQKLFLILDIASQPMVQAGNLPPVIRNYLKGDNRGLDFNQMGAGNIPGVAYVRLNRFLKGLKVQLICKDKDGYQPTRKIKSVEAVPANSQQREHVFEVEGATHTVESYFAKVYGVRLERPDFPVVAVSKTARWPIELCIVEAGQKCSTPTDQTADSIRLTTVAPAHRVPMLSEGLKRIQPGSNALKQWDIDISQHPIQVQARELPQPLIGYQRAQVRPQNGVWRINDRLHKAASIDHMLVLVFDTDRYFTMRDAQTSVMGVIAAAEDLGMRIGNRQPDIHYVPRGMDVPTYIKEKGFEMMQNEGGPPDLVLCFLPRKPCDQYGEIKRFGDITMGVATQCLFINKARRGNREYYQNVVLKMNHKLANGQNSVLRTEDLGIIAEKPTMIVGLDISHASPGSVAPSVAALVASTDERATVYGSAISVQPSRLEVASRLEEMMLKVLAQFTQKHGYPPQRIIFFRDGISEGQFSQVIATEVEACRLAAKKFGDSHSRVYEPELTFITCGKRHHISLFPSNKGDADPKTGNVKSGTVVDTGIVSSYHFDWYMQAHASLLGTGRSSHFTVLDDDAHFTSDQLQLLAFNLCFTYARATRAVSVATPAFYASRLCTRAQLLLKREDDDSTTVISTASGSSEERLRQQALAEYQSRLKAIHPNHDELLYWM